MEDVKSMFLELREGDKYQRIVTSHPVAWYIGLDGNFRYSLFAITDTQPKDLNSTRMINVFIGNRRDDRFGITFSLLNNSNIDLFVHFCEDMISYSRNISHSKYAADYICTRYVQWQKAFMKTEGKLLSYEQIKGLIGEMLFLKMKMIPLYGPELALNCWSGIEATNQDFTCDNVWFEVKSTVSGSSTIKISSVEQLDSLNDGHLVIMILDNTSEADSSKITLNSIVDLVIKAIPEKLLQEYLLNRLLAYGYYYDKAYDYIGFQFNGMAIYRVNENFPCLRKSQIPPSIQNVNYELYIAAIEKFKEE